MMYKQMALMVALCVLFSSSAIADRNVSMQFNPFAYADKKKISISRKPTSAQISNKLPKSISWKPSLLATIVAGQKSMANVEGRLVRIGQSVNGFTLLSVDKNSATFKKNAKKYVLKLAMRSKHK